MAEPLSFEKFQSLRQQGLSVDQIIRFEKGEIPKIGFLGGIKQDIGTRALELEKGFQRQERGQQTGFETVLQTAGQGAGLGFDILGRGISAVTPGFIQRPLQAGAEAISQTRPVQEISQTYESWKQQHPRAAANLEAIIDIGSFIPAIRGVGEAGKLATKGIRSISESVLESEITKQLSPKISQMIRGKSLQEVLETPEYKLKTLSPIERRAYFSAAEERIRETAGKTEVKIKEELQKKMIASQTEAEALKKELDTASRDEVISLRPKIRSVLANQSIKYRHLIDKELAPYKDIKVSQGELNKFVDERYSYDEERAKSVKAKLTVGKVGIVGKGVKNTFGELYNKTKSLGQEIGKTAKKGTQVYTPEEKLIDDSITTLVDFMKSKGIDLKEARKFWANYVPIRNQLVQQSRPFIQTGTQTKTFALTLRRIAQGTDVNNENFIKAVEDLIGQPLAVEGKKIFQKLDKNKKIALTNEVESKIKEVENQMNKDKALKALSDKEFEVERQARIRKWMKRILIGIGVYATEKTLKGAGVPFLP